MKQLKEVKTCSETASGHGEIEKVLFGLRVFLKKTNKVRENLTGKDWGRTVQNCDTA